MNATAKALALLLVSSAAALSHAQETPAAEPGTALPKVLIIGDSVSLGYTPTVVELLKDKATVAHNKDPDNAGSAERGLASIDAWLGTNHWDVIHFNWGLWDINRRVNGKRNLDGPIAASPEEYEQRLDKLVTRLRQTKAKLIWASTTYCSGGWGRRKGDDVTYNAVAAKIMEKHGIEVNDLHALSSGFAPELFKSPGNVHFADEGYRRLGEQVAAAILEALK